MQDLIDFPVSGAWLDHYHSQGMTPRHTPNYGHGSDLPPLRALDADIAVLRGQVSRLTAKLVEVEGLARQRPRAKPAPTPPAQKARPEPQGEPEFEV